MPGKYALIIGNTEYTDSGLAKLNAPGKDAEDFARALQSADIAAFDEVVTFINENVYNLNEAIEGFFSGKKLDDLLVFYFSGHGVRDESGSLFLAVKNTNRSRLYSTAITTDFVRKLMDQSRSKRQVIILDCCNSGAFAYGTKAETGGSMGIAAAFEGTGYGHVVLTATDSTQFAWEGDKIIGSGITNSLFTHFLIKGLEGDADEDGDGKITVDELYDYAYEKIVNRTSKQTPGKWSYKQQGEIVLRQSVRIKDIKPISLPVDLITATENTIPLVREGAVKQLESLLRGKNLGLARSAKETLERIVEEDDSRHIVQLAKQALALEWQIAELSNEKVDREAAEKAAFVKATHEAKKKAEHEAAEKEAHEKMQREQMEREAAENAALVKAKREAREKIERGIAEKKAREKMQHEQMERDAAKMIALEKEKREAAQKAEQKKPASSSFPIALGGFGFFFIIGILVIGTFLALKWLSPPATPVLTGTQTIVEVPVATETSVPVATARLIGISMPTKSSTRWISDGESMVEEFEAMGYDTDLQFADNDIPNQLAQIENMVNKGAKVLVIAAIDGTTLSDVLQKAHDSGTIVISYDRLITKTANVDYYATFDNFGVGVIQGTQLLEGLGLKPGEKAPAGVGPFNVELFGGSPDDTNAFYFYDGAMSVIQPFIDDGMIVIQSGQMGMDKVGTLRWLAATAQARMDNLLSTYYTDKRVDAILSPYDGLSIGILSSLKGVGYCTPEQPCPVVTGQDAEVASIISIIAGEQTYTVFKDTSVLAKQAVKMADQALKGEAVEINDTKTYDNVAKVVPSYLLVPISIDINNYQKELVDTGYITVDQLK